MKKAALLLTLLTAVALPALADDDRHQSYLSFEEGGTVVRSGEDGQDIQAHRNLPVYPGDEVITARRGRAEVRLADGNIIGIDRATSLRFRSILDAYEGDATETVVELRQGKVAVHRTDLGTDHVRLDTDNASYVAEHESVYSVETDSRGSDRVIVFDGSVEVRTPSRTTRLREGESASVDDSGTYDLVGDQSASADDFERWFLKRAERFGTYTNRYMDRRLSYWSDDLDDHGRWVMVAGIGWSWRPYVAVGW
ncbi:MAG TPA: FecR domain-containing protein, partial [Thermoanaerobaculia bacterium]